MTLFTASNNWLKIEKLLFFENLEKGFVKFHQNANLQKPLIEIIFGLIELQMAYHHRTWCRMKKIFKWGTSVM